MSDKHSSVQYEGRDTQNRKIFVLGIWMFAIMIGCSLLMIPVVKYLWHWAEKENPKIAESAITPAAPGVVLEVDPSGDLKKMREEYLQNGSAEKIKAAMEKALEEGFPVKA